MYTEKIINKGKKKRRLIKVKKKKANGNLNEIDVIDTLE